MDNVQPIPVRNESRRRKWLLLLLVLLLLLLSSIGVITGILVHVSKKYESVAKVQTTTAAYFETTTVRESAKNMTIGSRGKRFVVLFMKNLIFSTKNVYVTSEHGVQINITSSPRLDISLKAKIDKDLFIPSSQQIVLPQELELQSFRKEEKSILIETSSDVFVISHDDGADSVGSTTHIPLHKLSTKYVAVSTEPVSSWNSQLAVSAIEDNTTVSITFKMKRSLPLFIDRNVFNNGDVFNISLNRFQTYQIEHVTDLTGTLVESSTPIAVFSGNNCNKLENIGACDHLIEQLPPTDSVDNIYIYRTS